MVGCNEGFNCVQKERGRDTHESITDVCKRGTPSVSYKLKQTFLSILWKRSIFNAGESESKMNTLQRDATSILKRRLYRIYRVVRRVCPDISWQDCLVAGSALVAYSVHAVPLNFSDAHKRFLAQSGHTLLVFLLIKCAAEQQCGNNELAEMIKSLY